MQRRLSVCLSTSSCTACSTAITSSSSAASARDNCCLISYIDPFYLFTCLQAAGVRSPAAGRAVRRARMAKKGADGRAGGRAAAGVSSVSSSVSVFVSNFRVKGSAQLSSGSGACMEKSSFSSVTFSVSLPALVPAGCSTSFGPTLLPDPRALSQSTTFSLATSRL